MSQLLALVGTSVGFAVLACVCVALGWLVLRAAGPRHARTVHDLLVAVTVVIILAATLWPGDERRSPTEWELMPFLALVESFSIGPPAIQVAIADCVGNIILFAPLGAALALRWPALSTGRVLLYAAAFSTAIEVTQGVTALGRMAQSTDVLMNTTGAWLGFLLVRRVRAARDLPRYDAHAPTDRHGRPGSEDADRQAARRR